MKKLLFLIVLLTVGWGVLIGSESGARSCSRPLPHQKRQCQKMEVEILEATVRIQLHGAIEIEDGYEWHVIHGTISHGTVSGGRYLVTHDHFGIPLSQVSLYDQAANGEFTGVSVYKLNGEPILSRAPLTSFTVVEEKGETAVLDFGTVGGQGFFSWAGVRSAEFASWESVKLQPGMEVAQIDWDGEGRTYVVWTQISDIVTANGLPLVHVQNYIGSGASGGGVFLDGVHIGNSWSRVMLTGKTSGAVLGQFSIVALN